MDIWNVNLQELFDDNQLEQEANRQKSIEMDEKSLQIEVYEYCKNYKEKRIVGLITDKQFVMYTQCHYDGFNHDTALPYLDKKIYPFKNYHGFYIESKDISFAGDSGVIYFSMPEIISREQFLLMNDMLDEIEKYNNEVEYQDKVKMIMFRHTNCVDSREVQDVKEELRKIPIRDAILEKEEIIIGKAVNDIVTGLETFYQENTYLDESITVEEDSNKTL